MKKLAFLLILTVSPLLALNITYKNDTGEILELDLADQSYRLDSQDPNITTGTISDAKVPDDLKGLPSNNLIFNSLTQQVELKSQAQLDAIKKSDNSRIILSKEKELYILNELAKGESDQGVLTEIKKSTDFITLEINSIKQQIIIK